jgi:hypothetical protein
VETGNVNGAKGYEGNGMNWILVFLLDDSGWLPWAKMALSNDGEGKEKEGEWGRPG